MHFLIICRVIDNLGDAGFCTRLALQLHRLGHSVDLICDKPKLIQRLESFEGLTGIQLFDADCFENDAYEARSRELESTVILEPFGTSSEQTGSGNLNDKIKNQYPNQPWLVIDYLSAEAWTKSFHLSKSTCPRTGHISTYFYPGFEAGTGGVIYSDLPQINSLPEPVMNEEFEFNRVFVFSYPHTPLRELELCLTGNQSLTIAGDEATPMGSRARRAEFCRLTEFDALLQSYDFLFVRGEDSFVRAQLAGKPFVWNIYPTEDAAHAEKLLAFFGLYKQGLNPKAADALLSLWWIWNNLDDANTNRPIDLMHAPASLAEAWDAVQAASREFRVHALRWKSRLLNGPELVSEILTWASIQSPTSHK